MTEEALDSLNYNRGDFEQWLKTLPPGPFCETDVCPIATYYDKDRGRRIHSCDAMHLDEELAYEIDNRVMEMNLYTGWRSLEAADVLQIIERLNGNDQLLRVERNQEGADEGATA